MLTFGRSVLRGSCRQVSALASHLGWRGGPDFLIVGAQKSGTSALHSYLGRHPELSPAWAKELYYFSPESFDGCPDYPGSERHRRFARGEADPAVRAEALRWYSAQFRVPLPGRPRLRFESTPCYLFNPNAPRRIREYRPDMKLIVLLRDPVERAYSAWNMYRQFNQYPYSLLRDERTFEQALRDEVKELPGEPMMLKSDYLRRGIYHEQLRRYLRLFPREQLLVLDQRELLRQPRATLDAVCDFLGVGPPSAQLNPQRVLVGEYASGMSQWARDFLTDFFNPHNQALFELLGRSFDWARSDGGVELARQAVA